MDKEKVQRCDLRSYVTPLLCEIDPATYADRIDPARFLMINGRADDIIKYSVAKESWETYGKPDMYVLASGHYSTIFAKWYAIDKIRDHFMKVLGLEWDENSRVRPAASAAVGK
jgi:hypothetical protein